MAIQVSVVAVLLAQLGLVLSASSGTGRGFVASGRGGPRRRRTSRGFVVVDWDSDGDLDIIVGKRDGGLVYFENTGVQDAGCQVNGTSEREVVDALTKLNTSLSDEWDEPVRQPSLPDAPFEEPAILASDHLNCTNLVLRDSDEENPFFGTFDLLMATPEAVDWDGDGDLDLLVTSGEAVTYYERAGANVSGASAGVCIKSGYVYRPIDMSGHDGTLVENWQACQSRCAGVPGCVHFTYWSGEWATNCHLQDSQAELRRDSHSGAVAGERSCPAGSLIEHSIKGSFSAGGAGGLKAVDFDGDSDLDLFVGTRRGWGKVGYWEQLGSSPPGGNRTPEFCFEAARFFGSMAGTEGIKVQGGADACQARCQSIQGCTHFTFLYNGVLTNCHFHDGSSITRKEVDRASTVGPRECSTGSLVERTGADNPLDAVEGRGTLSIELADADGDGDVDALISDDDGKVLFWSHVGYNTGTFTRQDGPMEHIAIRHGPGATRMLDFDGDGRKDILMLGFYDFILYWHGGIGSPSFIGAGHRPAARALWLLLVTAPFFWLARL